MKIICIITLAFCSLPVFCQENNPPGKIINGLEFFTLGDPMAKFDGDIQCAGVQQANNSIQPATTVPCTIFRFLPAEKDSITVGSIRFATIILYKDTAGKLKNVLILKLYGKATPPGSGQNAATDYAALSAYLSTVFKTGEPYTDDIRDQYSKQGITWKNNNIKYSLALIKYKKILAKKIKIAHSIELEISGAK